MSNQDKIGRPNGDVWDTVKFACPNCGSTTFEFHMIDDEQHFVMQCLNCKAHLPDELKHTAWYSERYTHLPSDVKAPEWPYEPVSDDTQTVEVLVPVEDDGNLIAEVEDFRGKDCDEVIPAVAESLGEIKEDR
jgi:hypothetical protein